MILHFWRGKRAGFTLIEIMIVIAIIAILAGIVVPNFMKARAEAQWQQCCKNVETIGKAIATALVRHSDNALILVMIGNQHGPGSHGAADDLRYYGNLSWCDEHNCSLQNWLVENEYLSKRPTCPIIGSFDKDGYGGYFIAHSHVSARYGPEPVGTGSSITTGGWIVYCWEVHSNYGGWAPVYSVDQGLGAFL